MNLSKPTGAATAAYSFDVELRCSREHAWQVLVEKIDDWWLSDFRMLGVDSKVTLEAKLGGQLSEQNSSGAFLEWYNVQMCTPGSDLYLVGHLGEDWGGPTVSMMSLKLRDDGNRCQLKVSDALLGNVTTKSVDVAQIGWTSIFGDSYKAFAEK